MKKPDPWYVQFMPVEDFILGMLELGHPIETSLIGVFDETGRGSRRDIELPLHRDGVYSAKLAEAQGGEYVERPGVDIVGMYCIREGGDCRTILEDDIAMFPIDLQKGQALVFNNHRVEHGRRGKVVDRIVLRMWISTR